VQAIATSRSEEPGTSFAPLDRPADRNQKEETIVRRLSALTIAAAISIPGASQAQIFPTSINEAPRGPGTEQSAAYRTPSERVQPGWELGAQAGAGIGFGLSARAGYSFVPGIYLGGSYTHYFGSTIDTIHGEDSESQNILAGEIGYKIYPTSRVELRPFIMMGAGSFEQVDALGVIDSAWKFTIDPAFLVAYHVGNFFLSAEARLQVAPSPSHFAALGGLGFGL
jgi:hypothetical protein